MLDIFIVFVGILILGLLTLDYWRGTKGEEPIVTLGILRFSVIFSVSLEVLENVTSLL